MPTKKNKLLFYILLNIAISAATTMLVLFLWDRAHSIRKVEESLPMPSYEESITAPQELQTDTTTLTYQTTQSAETNIAIDGVFGSGMIDLEYIMLRNTGESAANLIGWQLVKNEEVIYIFPALTLNASGKIKVFSAAGSDSVIQLYLGSEQAIWKRHDKIKLIDPNGMMKAEYLIP